MNKVLLLLSLLIIILFSVPTTGLSANVYCSSSRTGSKKLCERPAITWSVASPIPNSQYCFNDSITVNGSMSFNGCDNSDTTSQPIYITLKNSRTGQQYFYGAATWIVNNYDWVLNNAIPIPSTCDDLTLNVKWSIDIYTKWTNSSGFVIASTYNHTEHGDENITLKMRKGVCGTAHTTTSAVSPPADTLCAVGSTAGAVTYNGITKKFEWTCSSSTCQQCQASCWANYNASGSTPLCGPAHLKCYSRVDEFYFVKTQPYQKDSIDLRCFSGIAEPSGNPPLTFGGPYQWMWKCKNPITGELSQQCIAYLNRSPCCTVVEPRTSLNNLSLCSCGYQVGIAYPIGGKAGSIDDPIPYHLFRPNGTYWQWMCKQAEPYGSGNNCLGPDISCSANFPPKCNSTTTSSTSYTSSNPPRIEDLCEYGQPYPHDNTCVGQIPCLKNEQWRWKCKGYYREYYQPYPIPEAMLVSCSTGGVDDPDEPQCNSTTQATPWGENPYPTSPSTILCSSGTPTTPIRDNNLWRWQCISNQGASVPCVATAEVLGDSLPSYEVLSITGTKCNGSSATINYRYRDANWPNPQKHIRYILSIYAVDKNDLYCNGMNSPENLYFYQDRNKVLDFDTGPTLPAYSSNSITIPITILNEGPPNINRDRLAFGKKYCFALEVFNSVGSQNVSNYLNDYNPPAGSHSIEAYNSIMFTAPQHPAPSIELVPSSPYAYINKETNFTTNVLGSYASTYSPYKYTWTFSTNSIPEASIVRDNKSTSDTVSKLYTSTGRKDVKVKVCDKDNLCCEEESFVNVRNQEPAPTWVEISPFN